MRRFVALAVIIAVAAPAGAQCDWMAKIVAAIQRRYATNEAACKALSLPPDEFNATHARIEAEFLREHPLVSSPQVERWLSNHSDRMLELLGVEGSLQRVHIAAPADPNAFATGQNVTFQAGLIDWYLSPETALTRLGLSRWRAREYLSFLNIAPPGENGLIGVLAHETAHNFLGHPDVRPLVLACEDYIEAGIREVRDYERLVSTGKRGSRFGAFFRAAAFLAPEVLFGSQRQQQFESDADELGAWLAYRITGDPNTMARSLQWLAAFPGLAGGAAGLKEVLCSNHPLLLGRVAKMRAAAFSVTTGPSQQLLALPQHQTKQRYEQLLLWYPARIETVDRIASGKLTDAELQRRRTVEVELKPREAVGFLDGQPITSGKHKLQLGLGPHLLVGETRTGKEEYRFVVLDEGPDKFKLEVKGQ